MAKPWPERPVSPYPMRTGNKSGKQEVTQWHGSSIRARAKKGDTRSSRRRRLQRSTRILGAMTVLAAVCTVALSVGTAEALAQTRSAPAYIWPVVGTVVDPFRPPSHAYGSGNRGLEFATQPGSAFWAANDGVISFAGPVGGRLHVTVSHPDGLRVSYSGVATIGVVRGERVRQGQQLGTVSDRLHVGVRRGEVYLDPGKIFARAANADPHPSSGRPKLVPSAVSVYRLQLRWLHSGAGIAVL